MNDCHRNHSENASLFQKRTTFPCKETHLDLETVDEFTEVEDTCAAKELTMIGAGSENGESITKKKEADFKKRRLQRAAEFDEEDGNNMYMKMGLNNENNESSMNVCKSNGFKKEECLVAHDSKEKIDCDNCIDDDDDDTCNSCANLVKEDSESEQTRDNGIEKMLEKDINPFRKDDDGSGDFDEEERKCINYDKEIYLDEEQKEEEEETNVKMDLDVKENGEFHAILNSTESQQPMLEVIADKINEDQSSKGNKITDKTEIDSFDDRCHIDSPTSSLLTDLNTYKSNDDKQSVA